GYPTANVRLGRRASPVGGIFAVRVHRVEAAPMPGVASLGIRPTIDGTEPLLEAHLFDFDGDLYGRRIEVEFVAKLRDEAKFADLDAMVRQIHLDAAEARAILEANPHIRRPGESRDQLSLSPQSQNGFRLSPE
ncbi:MAG TPA: riboflavin kinase, partial [Rhodanobacteraceae bacterium]|nr:riboflavin kinase [Rhodanobacteraceae bacterium]